MPLGKNFFAFKKKKKSNKLLDFNSENLTFGASYGMLTLPYLIEIEATVFVII